MRWFRAYRVFGRAAQVVEDVARFVQWQRLADTVVSLRVERQAGREFYLFLTLDTEHWGVMPDGLEETLADCRALSQPFGDALTLEDIQGMASGDLQVRALGQCLTYRALVRESDGDPFELEARTLARDAEVPAGAADRLLWFLSASGAGSWASFRAACAALGVPDAVLAGRLARHLRLLGHLEVHAGGRWVVTPPGVVTGWAGTQPVRFLVGARDARTAQGMTETSQAGGPTRWQRDQMEAGAGPEDLGMAAEHLWRVLPDLRDFRVGMERLGSLNAERAVTGRLDGLQIRPGRFDGTAGLYEWRDDQRTRHALFLNGDWWVGEFFTLRFLAVQAAGLLGAWQYDAGRRELAIRHEERLPELYERVLVLCSGLLPEHRGGWLVYGGVPLEIVSGLSVRLDVAVEFRQADQAGDPTHE